MYPEGSVCPVEEYRKQLTVLVGEINRSCHGRGKVALRYRVTK